MRILLGCWLLLWLTGCVSQRDRLPDPEQAQAVAFTAMHQVGVPYRYGGSAPHTGFDCSGLIGYVYQHGAGVSLPRTVRALSELDAPEVDNSEALYTGDLVLFRSGRSGQPDHAGIYVGKGRFVHAPSRGGKVRLEPIDRGYWADRFIKAKRPLVR